MNKAWQPIEDRISNSLERAGFEGFKVTDRGSGDIEIVGAIESRDDRALVIAAAKAVPGVKSVSSAVRTHS